MTGKRMLMMWMLAVGSVMLLSACDQGSNAANTAEPPMPTAGDDHAGHAHGEQAPSFTLPGADGQDHNLSDYEGKWVVLEWINHGCPYVKKFYDAGEMQELQQQYTDQGVAWLRICSSTEGAQGYYTPDQWRQQIEQHGSHATATLLDVDGKVGKAYGAKTTPHMFVINPQGEIVYKGGIDDKPTPDAASLQQANNYVVNALDAGMAGNEIETSSAPPYGCSVKYPN